MTIATLKQIKIESLRGSIKPFILPFEKSKRLTVIYGENATGKSTICDAFEFLGKGKVGSLDNRGLGRTDSFWPSLGKTPNDISVNLETANDNCKASIQNGQIEVSPANSRPRVEVLRRSQIRSLIEARPGERYEEIRSFIDVSNIEASEATLNKLIKGIEKDREVAIARVQENQESIQHFWEEAGKPGKEPISWAKIESAKDENQFDVEIKAIEGLRTEYSRLKEFPEAIKGAEETLKGANESLEVAQKELDQCISKISEGAGEMVGILEAAKSYFTIHSNPEICPLCESPDKAKGLPGRVESKLNDFSELRKAQKSKTEKEKLAQKAKEKLNQLQEEAKAQREKYSKASQESGIPSNDIKFPADSLPSNFGEWPEWLTQAESFYNEWGEALNLRQANKKFITTLKRAFKTFTDNLRSQKEIDVLLPKLKKALDIIKSKRRDFTDNILSKISKDVGKLYEKIHPGEGLDKISLKLDPKKRASLDIGTSFCGQDGTPPQAYFSDSHLDTLGLCIFFALSKLDKPKETILVLDDVLGSVDEPHVDRLIEMLYDEAQEFHHCLITTHYGPWKHKLRWGWLKNGQCQFVELGKWSSLNGISFVQSIPDIDRLRILLAESPPDPQLVCAKAGVILEAALDFLTLLYECKVPRRQGGLYTLGDLLPSIDKKLRAALKVEILKETDASGKPVYDVVELESHLKELIRIAQVRNVFGCHFNQISFELLDSDALPFGQQILELMDVLIDQENGWPKNGKSGSYWTNAGETRRLHPLRTPG